MIDVKVKLPDGSSTRIRKVSPVPTEEGALDYEQQVREEILLGVGASVAGDVPVLAVFADFFLETYAVSNNRPGTVREKRRALGRGMLDMMGHLRLDQIGIREIESYKTRRVQDGVGPKTINEELAILSKLLGYAEEVGKLRARPPKICRLMVPPPLFDFLEFEEAERLLEAASLAADPWCAMVSVALGSGLRLGELRGLRWEDVDLDAAKLTVRRSADDEGELHPPNGGGGRVVDLPRRTVAVLRAHQHRRGPFVFCQADGSMLMPWVCGSRGSTGPLAKICRDAGLRRVGWKSLRHTYASHLVMLVASLVVVKELLGHASLETTMRYAHLSPMADRRAVVALLDRTSKGTTRGIGRKGGR